MEAFSGTAGPPGIRRQGPLEWAVFALGFRPFYLLAALFAAAALPLWAAVYTGAVHLNGYLAGVAWHSHEMLFGFATAVIAGFLLTAVRNWTGLPTPSGPALAALAAAWVLARVLAVTGPGPAAAIVDTAFLPALGLALALPIWRSRNTRNAKILVVLAALALLNGVCHLAYLEVLPAGSASVATRLALDLITLLMAIVGGRVIPAFTANAVPGAGPRRIAAVEYVSFATLLAIPAAALIGTRYPLPAPAWIVLLAAAALAQTVRVLLWRPVRTRGNALLAMLPVAYGWIPLSLALRALAHAALVPVAAATHALTIGAMSSLMLAMMMRSALGHTGRTLVAGRCECGAFVLLQLAAAVRVIGAAVPGLPYRATALGSAVLWSLAFAVFLFRYWPILTRPRIDARPG